MVKAKIIAIGDEILIGQTLDTNSNFLAKELKNLGVALNKIVVCSDDYDEILEELQSSLSVYDLVFITGGLGPTKDDRTKQCLCDFLECQLVSNTEVLKNVERIIIPRAGKMNQQNIDQALVPEKAIPIQNQYGTAPILKFEKLTTRFYSMPGVPFEMKTAFKDGILPEIQSDYNLEPIATRNIMVYGIGESFLAEKLHDWENGLPSGLGLAYLPSLDRLKLRLSYSPKEIPEAEVDMLVEQLSKIIPEYLFSYREEHLVDVVARKLLSSKQTLALAESCTGGHLAHLFTQKAGASAFFTSSVVAYTNKVKAEVLNIDPAVLETYGEVSSQVAEVMAENVRQLMGSDFGLATTGYLGPTGGSEEASIGTVWLAVASQDGVVSKKVHLGDVRERDIIRASVNAINLLRLQLN